MAAVRRTIDLVVAVSQVLFEQPWYLLQLEVMDSYHKKYKLFCCLYWFQSHYKH